VAADGRSLDCEASWRDCLAQLAAAPPAERVLYYQGTAEWNPALNTEEDVRFIPHPNTLTKAGAPPPLRRSPLRLC